MLVFMEMACVCVNVNDTETFSWYLGESLEAHVFLIMVLIIMVSIKLCYYYREIIKKIQAKLLF